MALSDCRHTTLSGHSVPNTTRKERPQGKILPASIHQLALDKMAEQLDARRSVLITGCSLHGLGHALAIAFHNVGLRVFATARDPEKMTGLAERGIECLKLDVCDEESISACVEKVRRRTWREDDGTEEGRLDCLVNNAGGGKSWRVCLCCLQALPAFLLVHFWTQEGNEL